MTCYKIVLQQPYQQQQQERTELPWHQALPKLPMQQFGIFALLIIGSWGRVCCGMCLDSTQTPPTTVMRYNMQNNYFISAFRKWPNTASWGSVRISVMDISMWWLSIYSSWREFTVLNSPKGFWRSLPEISLLLSSFGNPNHLKTWFPNSLVPFPLSIRKAECLARSQTFPQFIRPMSLLSYTSKTKTDCIEKYYFGKLCTYIHKS